jgi:hypothetical protein
MSAAQEHYKKQKAADKAHRLKNIAWLSDPAGAKWSDGEPLTRDTIRQLIAINSDNTTYGVCSCNPPCSE